jgi:hypothetical protein
MNHVWRIGPKYDQVWVVASSAEEAWECLLDQHGNDDERDEFEEDGIAWEQLPDTDKVTICCDDEGDPCDCDECGEEGVVTKTCAEWALRGPGFLCEDE